MKKIRFLLLVFLVVSPNAFAQWVLSVEDSTVNFVTVRASTLGEVSAFTHLSGSLSEKGKASLSIDLNSVETNIDIRNKHLKEVFFKTDTFPAAKVDGKVDLSKLLSTDVGSTYVDTIEMVLSLHGKERAISSTVRVTKLTNDRVLVTSLEPIIIDAATWGYLEAIEKLKELSGLSIINTPVPVTLSLIFTRPDSEEVKSEE